MTTTATTNPAHLALYAIAIVGYTGSVAAMMIMPSDVMFAVTVAVAFAVCIASVTYAHANMLSLSIAVFFGWPAVATMIQPCIQAVAPEHLFQVIATSLAVGAMMRLRIWYSDTHAQDSSHRESALMPAHTCDFAHGTPVVIGQATGVYIGMHCGNAVIRMGPGDREIRVRPEIVRAR